ncbi:putative 2-oxo-4-hydroxy-4-carboxy-5-ureidoimidazoline decarboxylase isoform X1 [Tachyglossus aculeatus]|uniref:putative 2-oxo-4-hydroxy-4-carboxy-5-ureidoimidazoline decarboxylase isoform X1 n=1 Tax=Tachyglossus aculeatus TaxID=9261 RepID=UPI0018F50B11|nr:putative 2-oxo-4-hydroxy-4-carboxy-5-ureidoimidazoline decarboxylase isoform X1 [Tachyglossus aculeatus]
MDMRTVNAMDFGEFIEVFGNVVEKCPLAAAAVWGQRPFSSPADFERRLGDFIDSLPRSGQEGILRCHPDLAGPELQRGTLTKESQREQGQAGLTALQPEEKRQLAELNAQYRARFNFPFVMAARLSDKATVLRELARRARQPPKQELATAMDEVKKICHLRLEDIFADSAKL